MPTYRQIDDSSEILFEETLKKVQGQLEIKRKDAHAGLKLLEGFSEFENCKRLFVHKVTELKGKSGSFIILLVEKHLTIFQHKKNVRIEKEIEEVEPILIFNSAEDLGRAYIRKESLADKFVDWFVKQDIDFVEYPNFSKNYHVVGEHPEQVKRHMPKRLLEALDGIQDMVVEINGKSGLIRTEKNLTEKNLLLLIRIGTDIVK